MKKTIVPPTLDIQRYASYIAQPIARSLGPWVKESAQQGFDGNVHAIYSKFSKIYSMGSPRDLRLTITSRGAGMYVEFGSGIVYNSY